MATDRDFVDYVAEQAQLGSALSFRKMFGEYGVYLDGIPGLPGWGEGLLAAG